MWQEEFRKVLISQFESCKSKNPRYSLRAFSKKIGLAAGPLSELVRGKADWRLSAERAARILDRLEINRQTRNRILVKMGEPGKLNVSPLTSPQYGILADWTYFPILFAFDLPAEHHEAGAIAARLGITAAKVEAVTRDLLRLGLLRKDGTGKVYRPGEDITTTDGITSELVRRHHESNLELSKRALAQIPVERRDFTSLTFVGNQRQLAYLRGEIRKLYRKAAALVDRDEPNDSVFRLSIQLFPMEFKP